MGRHRLPVATGHPRPGRGHHPLRDQLGGRLRQRQGRSRHRRHRRLRGHHPETNAWDDGYDTRGKRIAVVGTGSSGVQIAAALSAEAANLDVYQRTPAWVLPKIDFDIPPLMRRILRMPGVVDTVNVAGRLAMDAFM